MSVKNGYCTLEEFKDWKASGTALGADVTDDAVIENIIEAASRYIDNETKRWFYPQVETRYFDPPENTDNDRGLWLDADLLEVLTLTNGDATVITAADYNLYPLNENPKSEIRLTQSSSYFWEADSNGNTEGVISLAAIWAKHRLGSTAQTFWSGSTLNEGGVLAIGDLTWTMTSGTPFVAGQVVRIEDELATVSGVVGNDVTVMSRGDNGSTAATHADGTTVYIWLAQHDIRSACLQIVTNVYSRRYGQNTTGSVTITGAGVVITPQDVPGMVRDIIRQNTRWH